LQGGEPLLNPKIISMLERLSTRDIAKNLSIWITTNATQYNEKLFDTLTNFKEVKIIFSIDGVGKTNEYLRYPSRWADIEHNVKKFRILANATFQISFTVQSFNLLDIKNIIDFSNENKIHLKLNLLYIPKYLRLHVLPKGILQRALDLINQIEDSAVIHVTNFYEIKTQIQSALENPQTSEQELVQLIGVIGKRDAYRKTNIKNYLPEIAKGLNI
jgi:sulfatase maturation enzyme AslB (radical SAM superfamily)